MLFIINEQKKSTRETIAIPTMSKYKEMEQEECVQGVGPPAWIFLHTVAHNYPLKPTRQDVKIIKTFKTIGYILPCKYCRFSYQQYYKEYLSLGLDCRENASLLVVLIHNKVNAKLEGQLSLKDFKIK